MNLTWATTGRLPFVDKASRDYILDTKKISCKPNMRPSLLLIQILGSLFNTILTQLVHL
jgi:hypothetical protein